MHAHDGGKLGQALWLTGLLLLLELGGGFYSHSLALLSDAGHVLTDIAAIALAWFAMRQAQRPADHRRTYGYQRAELLAAMANAVVLILLVVAIAVQAVARLFHPEPVAGAALSIVGLAGLALNLVILTRLGGFHAGSANLRAVALHVGGDLLGGAGVVVAGVVIVFSGYTAIDPLISLLIAVLIAVGAVRLVRDTVDMLLESAPRGVRLPEVEALLLEGEGVSEVHDLHVWSIAEGDVALSAHLVVPDQSSLAAAEHLVAELSRELDRRFGIGHSTIQVEACHPCAEPAH